MSFVGIALVGDNDSARVTRLLGALSDYILFWENTYDDVNAGWTIESFGRFSPDRSAHPFTTVHAGWGLIKIWQALSGDPTWSVTYATLVSRLSALIIKVADALVDAYVGPAGTWTVPWRSCLYWNSHTAVWAGSPPPPVSTPVRDYWFDVHNTVMAVNVGSATSTEIAQARQIGSMFLTPIAWAYAATGTASYKTVCDDLRNAAWSGDDTYRALGYDSFLTTGTNQKLFNEMMRHCSDHLVYRDGVRDYP
jgi:hypothetical protein